MRSIDVILFLVATPLYAATTAVNLLHRSGESARPSRRALLDDTVLGKCDFRRWQTADDIPKRMVSGKRSFSGVVTSVSDGDTMRVRHMPWLLTDPRFSGRASDHTIAVRIGAVDCPEIAHFGNKGQPFGEDAKDWVKKRLLNKWVTVKVLAKDQYSRVVGMVYYRNWFTRNLSKELLKAGLAQVYRQSGAQYDGEKQAYEKLEARAKANKRGIWSLGKKFESAAEYKAKHK
eukprot:gnl/TRDRNA2_/TRDRNA2_44861_c0_seq1.p2 gnl/TRDRNA2_/TRDRNA2_44861_c0~~gnl/TRDRNA2_/TRDRNA2_44861_c0_seq1.p2  ORF type:complete len:232 (+),score=37.52 gnl/TRDRNA2_/TRDRNA2_44861_c0_seq1:45-740(+)